MSDVHAIGIIALLYIVGTALLFHMTYVMHRKTTEILVGLSNGVPITTELRILDLLQTFALLMILVVAFSFTVGFGFVQFVGLGLAPGVERFAMLCGASYFLYSGVFAVVGPIGIISIRRHLLQCAEDPVHMETDAMIMADANRRARLLADKS